MKLKYTLLITTLLAASSAMATKPDWDFIQAGYQSVDIDDFDETGPSGIGISGSKLIGESIFLVGSYSMMNYDYVGIDVDFDQGSAGIGYRYGTSKSTDVYAVASYQYVKVSISGFDEGLRDDDNGYGLALGVRSRLYEKFQIDGSISYVSIDSESETTFGLAANYYFTPAISGGLSYAASADADTIGAFVRYSF